MTLAELWLLLVLGDQGELQKRLHFFQAYFLGKLNSSLTLQEWHNTNFEDKNPQTNIWPCHIFSIYFWYFSVEISTESKKALGLWVNIDHIYRFVQFCLCRVLQIVANAIKDFQDYAGRDWIPWLSFCSLFLFLLILWTSKPAEIIKIWSFLEKPCWVQK